MGENGEVYKGKGIDNWLHLFFELVCKENL